MDAHAWRQSVSFSIARNFTRDFNILHPRTNEIFPPDNNNRYFFVEFPLYGFIVGNVFAFTGLSYQTARVLSMMLSSTVSALSAASALTLTRSVPLALSAGIIAFLMPVSYQCGNSLIPETLLAALVSLHVLLLVNRGRGLRRFKGGFLVASLLVLCKPMVGMLTLPLFTELLHARRWSGCRRLVLVLISGLTVIAPLLLWLWYTKVTYWDSSAFRYTHELLSASGAGGIAPYARFLLVTNLPNNLTWGGLIMMCLGAAYAYGRRHLPPYQALIWSIAGFVLWLFSAPNGFFRHDYYLLPATGLIAVLCTLGIMFLRLAFERLMTLAYAMRIIGVVTACVVGLGILGVSINQGTRFISSHRQLDVQFFGDMPPARKVIPENALVVSTGWTRNPTFLELADRRGWVINSEFFEQSGCPPEYRSRLREKPADPKAYVFYVKPYIEDKIGRGATMLVLIRSQMPTTYERYIAELKKSYIVVYASHEITVFRLENRNTGAATIMMNELVHLQTYFRPVSSVY